MLMYKVAVSETEKSNRSGIELGVCWYERGGGC